MHTVKLTWIIAFTILLASQWLGHLFVANMLSQADKKPLVEPSDKTTQSSHHNNAEIKANISLSPNDLQELKKAISLLIQSELSEIKASNATQQQDKNKSTVKSTEPPTIDLAQAEKAYSVVSTILSDAEIGGEWSKDTNAELAPYIDQLTPQQRRDVMSAYVRAFRRGDIDRDVIPPF
jgi:hypothetical protein